jgi:hypothetical protein
VEDPISGNYTTSIKAKPEETEQTFTNLQTNGVQAKNGKGARDVLADLSRKSVGEYTRWTELNGSIKAIISRPNSEWELVDS